MTAAIDVWPAAKILMTRIGLVKPNARMEAAIYATCAGGWVRGFRA